MTPHEAIKKIRRAVHVHLSESETPDLQAFADSVKTILGNVGNENSAEESLLREVLLQFKFRGSHPGKHEIFENHFQYQRHIAPKIRRLLDEKEK